MGKLGTILMLLGLLLPGVASADPFPNERNNVSQTTSYLLYSNISMSLDYLSIIRNQPLTRSDTEKEIPPLPKVDELPEVNIKSWRDWRDYRPYFPSYWNIRRPRLRVITKYKGFHGVVYRQLTRLAEKYAMDQVKVLWENSTLHPMDLANRQKEFREFRNEDNWWDNLTWMDSLLPEKGGITTVTHTIGHRITILELGPLQANNEGKISLKGWNISISGSGDSNPKSANKSKHPKQSLPNIQDELEVITEPSGQERVTLGVKGPLRSLWASASWDLSGDLDVRIKPTWGADWSSNSTEILGTLRLGLLTRQRKTWLRIEFEVSVKPFKEELSAEVKIAMLTW